MESLFSAVSNGIIKKRKTPLREHERTFIRQQIQQLDSTQFKGKPITSIIAILIELFSTNLDKLPKIPKELPIDMHEILANEIGKDPETSLLEKKVDKAATVDKLLQSPYVLQRIFNPSALYRKAYLILDRKFQTSDINNINEFKWHIASTNRSFDPFITAATTAPFKDIIKIKMFPFRFPNSENTVTEFNRLSVEIMELNSQACIFTHINKRFHFSFNIELLGPDTRIDPYNMNDIGNSFAEFEFHDPIIELNTITVRFGNPETLINLDPDSLYGVVSAVGAQTLITFTQPHYCPIGSTIVISDFNTTNPISDAAIINLLNNANGLVIVALTTLTITIDIDISGLVGIIDGNPFYIYLNGKRFALRLELTYLANS